MQFSGTENYVSVLGRTILKGSTRYLGYSCSGIAFQVTTKKVMARLWTDGAKMAACYRACLAVFINDEEVPRLRLTLNEEEADYCLFESDTIEKVKIKLVKYSEDAFATIAIKSLETEGDVLPKPIKLAERKLLFIGDSITCGYGIEGEYGKGSFMTSQENPWEAYAAYTARLLSCDFHLVAWSGIGIISSWTENDLPVEDPLMPQIYPYSDPGLVRRFGRDFAEKWEPATYQPDCVILHLGTNDESYTKNKRERVASFGKVYGAFLQQLRREYPKAQIICMLGIMGDSLYLEIEKQVILYQQMHKDTKVIAQLFTRQQEEDGIGTDWHPSRITHEKVAKQLAEVIKKVMKW